MNDWIGNIFYFGSPKDGFKVYPDLGAVSNVFRGYYSNTETDWVLVVRKLDDITRYTYVRYGLLTSLIEGRTGSCFGISIDFVNHYFTDLKVFLTEIFEGIWGAILDEKQLLEAQESSGKVAFKSYDLHDVGPYLDEMSKKIREVIRNKKYSEYLRPSYEIPQAGDDQIYGLHPNSSPSALLEYFRTYGAIKLAPNLPIEIKSLSEKQEEHKESLQKKVELLTEQLRKKDRELQTVNQKFERLQGLVKPIVMEFPPATPGNQSYIYAGNSRPLNQTHEPLSHGKHQTSHVTHNPSHESELGPKTRKIIAIIAGASILLALAIISAFYLFSDETKQDANSNQPIQPVSQPTATVAVPDPLLIVRQNGIEMEVLNEAVFLEHARGKSIFDEADFKEVLTSYLFQVSPEVRDVYKGSKDELWKKIMDFNPRSRQKLKAYLNEKQSFKIESNVEQQAILRGLVVVVK
jgi:hypothetical protein